MSMDKIRAELAGIVEGLYGEGMGKLVVLSAAPEGTGADMASNVAMILAGKLKRASLEVGEEILAEILKGDGVYRQGEMRGGKLGEYEVWLAKPGFLNFKVSDAEFLEKVGRMGQKLPKGEELVGCDDYAGKQVITEFSDPNPFKVLHVGHLYTSVVGEAISRLFELAGAEVHRVNFGGDVGMHAAKTMYELMRRREEFEAVREESAEVRAEFMAKCYVAGAQVFETDEIEKAKITDLNREIYELVEKGEKESELAKVYWEARKWSYEYFEDFYEKIGVKFEKFYPESSVAGKGLAVVKQGLADGVYEESEGAVVFSGEKYGLHTRVFINQMGLPTYEAKDVGLSFTKWEDYHFDESVIITGNDIIDYMKVVLASIGKIEKKLAERTVHLTHGNVRLPGNEKMSSRKGNFLKATGVIEGVREVMEKKYGKVDQRVVLGAVKYAFLKYKMGGNIIFDVEESVSMTGNSGPYLQYATVRGKKILEKCGGCGCGCGDPECDFGGLCCNGEKKVLLDLTEWNICCAERGLVKKVAEYEGVVREAVLEKAPHKICGYLYELAQEFSRFYEKVVVCGSEFEKERAVLVRAYVRVMEHGLGILGIEVPEEM